jgi:hypothetical protein
LNALLSSCRVYGAGGKSDGKRFSEHQSFVQVWTEGVQEQPPAWLPEIRSVVSRFSGIG